MEGSKESKAVSLSSDLPVGMESLLSVLATRDDEVLLAPEFSFDAGGANEIHDDVCGFEFEVSILFGTDVNVLSLSLIRDNRCAVAIWTESIWEDVAQSLGNLLVRLATERSSHASLFRELPSIVPSRCDLVVEVAPLLIAIRQNEHRVLVPRDQAYRDKQRLPCVPLPMRRSECGTCEPGLLRLLAVLSSQRDLKLLKA